MRDFPGGPVAKTSCFQGRGPRFYPKIPPAPAETQHSQIYIYLKKKTKAYRVKGDSWGWRLAICGVNRWMVKHLWRRFGWEMVGLGQGGCVLVRGGIEYVGLQGASLGWMEI